MWRIETNEHALALGRPFDLTDASVELGLARESMNPHPAPSELLEERDALCSQKRGAVRDSAMHAGVTEGGCKVCNPSRLIFAPQI